MDKRFPPERAKKTGKDLLETFLIGGISGTCSTVLFQPFDVIKTRLQTGHGKVRFLATFQQVIQNDGVRGLWKGTTPSLLRAVPGIGMYFTVLHYLSGLYRTPPGAIQAAFLGFVARCSVGTVLLPFQVLKTRFESNQFGYKSLSHAASTIWRTEGASGFYRGLVATLARDAPFSSIYLLFFVESKKLAKSGLEVTELNAEQRFCCGIVAGVLACVATHPPDVLKTKLQLREFRKTLHALQHIVEVGGVSGLYRGLLPRLYRRSLMAAFTWTVYEEIMQALSLKSEKQIS